MARHIYLFPHLHPPAEHFWVSNISNRIVSLTDLGLCIQPQRTVDLLDPKHYSLTKEQLLLSAKSGSIAKKKRYIVVRKVAPGTPVQERIPVQENATIPSRQRSGVKIEHKKYEELELSDDEYAEENAELAEIDRETNYKK